MNKKFQIIIFLLLIFSASKLEAQEVIWLSNSPPAHKKKASATYGMHKLSALRGKRGSMSVVQWVRSGHSVEGSRYITKDFGQELSPYIFSPSGEKIEAKFEVGEKETSLSYNGNLEGFYNEYLVGKKIGGDTLYITVAKAELLNHVCRNGHKHVLKGLPAKIYPKEIPFEIVRERIAREDFHTFIASGDEIVFTTYLEGKTVENATLSLFTQKDWEKTQPTDKNGQSRFQFVQDYFSTWKEFNNRNINYYLLKGEITIAQEGIHNEQVYNYIHYTTTLSDGYYPSKLMYSSLFWALVVFLAAIILPAIGIFIYRERRKRPFKELDFYEKN